MNTIKKLMTLLLVMLALTACCPFHYLVPQDKIGYTNSHVGDSLNYAFDVVNIRHSNRKDHCLLYQAIKTDAPTVLNKKDIAVYLIANEDAVPFYEKLGMKRADDVMQYNHIEWTEWTVE